MTPRQKRLLFQCQHRGSKELDALLSRYAAEKLRQLSEEEMTLLEAFLELPESHLWDVLSGAVPALEPYTELVADIRKAAMTFG